MTKHRKTYDQLRSARWFAPDDLRSFGHRSRMMQMGLSDEDWEGKPVIAIINTWSDLSPCHHHLRDRAEQVKRGILQAGGLPAELPVHDFSEQFLKPTSMLYRNMGALEVEETLRSHPVDGVVLMGGCDKSTPALVMGAVSMGIPFIYMPAGAMLRGNYAGETLGSGTDVWRYWDERRAGTVGKDTIDAVQGGIARSYGTCMTMGTASTMMSIAEGFGLTLPGASSIPAPDAGHKRMAAACGRRIVEMVWEDLTPDKIITPASTRNASIVAMATGCSTNAIIHLIAMARRAGVEWGLDDLDQIGHEVPVIANIRPSGKEYLMEDFFYAGGLPALMVELGDARVEAVWRDAETGRPLIEQFRVSGLGGDDDIAFATGSDALDLSGLLGRGQAFVTMLDGGPGNDTLSGTEGRDRLDGGSGSDRLFGLGGDDRLWGDTANGSSTDRDTLFAGLLRIFL